jgi:molecular chaperone GrpE
MFFKKKKTMNEESFDKEQLINDQGDNMTQEGHEAEEERLAQELNVDDSVRGTSHLDDEMGDEGELEKMSQELAEVKDKYVRLVAEFDNFRRRNARERIELIQTAGKDIVQALLVVLDDTDRAAKQMEASTDLETTKEGVTLVFNKLRNTLHSKGLKKMESIGQSFDADLHEAITEVPAPSEDMKGKVLDEIEPGYYLNDKLIRHARVIVGK